MKLINLTTHMINIIKENGEIVDIETSGTVARCKQEEQILFMIDGIKVTEQRFGEVGNLPEPKCDTFYIM